MQNQYKNALIHSTFLSTLFTCTHVYAAASHAAIVGVNVVGVDETDDHQQDDLILQLMKNQVTVVRTALGGHGEGYTNFVIKAYQRGIGAVHSVSFSGKFAEARAVR